MKWRISRETSGVQEEVTRDDDAGWRTVVSPRGVYGTERDLTDWRELLQEAYAAYCTNPLAYAVIEQSVNFVLGGGAHVVAAVKRTDGEALYTGVGLRAPGTVPGR